MNVSTLITMLVGLAVPALIALVTRETLPAKVKVLVTLFLTTVAGVLTGVIGRPPASLSGWEHVMLNIVLTYVAAAASDVAAWIPTRATKAIHRATDPKFGLGPPPAASS